MSAAPRVRIAPSPTGDPHVGTAYVALFNRAFADREGGSFLLRIDDTDRTRYQADSEAQIFRALRWLGIEWDEGPDIGGPHAPYRQSERTSIHREACENLIRKGAAYRCFRTPEELERLREARLAAGGKGGFDRSGRDLPAAEVERLLAAGRPHVVRLRVPLASGTIRFRDELRGVISIDNEEIDDQVLMKSDGFPTYHLANCVDDSTMGITHVIRAEEWITSTPKHALIYEALGEPLPRFIHVPLLRNSDRSKISKRKNPVSLDYYREQGYLPEALVNFLATLGWSAPDEREIFDYAYFRDHFRPADISLGEPVFDLDRLRWVNGHHLRALSREVLLQRLREGGFSGELRAEQLDQVHPIIAERLHLLSDFAHLTNWVFGEPDEFTREDLCFKKTPPAETAEILARAEEALRRCQQWTAPRLESELEERRTEWGVKKPQLFVPMRVALTGRRDAPGIAEILVLLGRERSVDRLSRARTLLESAP